MVKQLFLPAFVSAVLFTSCAAIKSLNFTSNKQVAPASAEASQTRFLEDISVTPVISAEKKEIKAKPVASPAVKELPSYGSNIVGTPVEKTKESELNEILARRTPEVEAASSVQLKYSILLQTEVESLPSKQLLENVDEWYGTRYRRGGNTKSGVDCSGFTVAIYTAVYGMMLPRISREQYRISRKISTTELQEGDLVFFNTTGRGVSHVGVYLGNNHFAHASVSRGVMVSSLSEKYYVQRFVGAGRIDNKQLVASN